MHIGGHLRSWIRAAVAGLVVATVCSACSSSEDAPPAENAETMTFEVLFAGVDGTMDLAGRERLDLLPVQLAETPVDVLCLQGISGPADRAGLKLALAKVFPVSLDLPTDDDSRVDDPRDASGMVPPPETSPPCKGEVEASLISVQNCLNAEGCLSSWLSGVITRTECLASALCAPDSLFAADPERRCRSCLVGHARSGSGVLVAATRCRELIHPLNLHGQHGMMILSKHPLSRPSLHVLPSEGTRRAILGATVTTPRGASIDVFCASLGPTHPSALPNDPIVTEPYPGPYGAPRDGWLRENALHIEKLGAHVKATRGDRPAVVLGNFGVSPEVARNGSIILPPLGALGAARLDELFSSGVAATYATSCTACIDNPFAAFVAPSSFDNRIYLAGLPTSAVRSSVRSYLGAVLAPDPVTSRGRAPISMQYGFRSRIAIPQQ